MARHSLVTPFEKFRGTVSQPGLDNGQILYDDPKRGLISRNYTKTPNPRSAAQIAQRSRIALCAQAWRALDAVTAAAWRSLAATLNRTSALGFTYRLTGINLFYMVNIYRQLNAQAITSTPPSLTALGQQVTRINSINGLQPNLLINVDCGALPDGYLIMLRVTNGSPYQSRLFRRCELRIPTSDASLSFATVAAGQANWIIVCDQVNIGFSYFVGIEFLALSPEYLPHAPLFIPIQFIYP